MLKTVISMVLARKQKWLVINLVFWQRGRLEEQEKRAAAVLETHGAEERGNKNEDDSYEVTLDDDFLTALEYGMPPASGMVWLSFFSTLILLELSGQGWIELLLFMHLERASV